LLLITKRHVGSWFDATPEEQQALIAAIPIARAAIEGQHQPEGWNIGINVGEVGGQTIDHLHVHLIPRYAGDVPDPRGGVRHVIPGLGNYLQSPQQMPTRAPHDRSLIRGDISDPLIEHLLAHLDHAIGVDLAVAFILESGVRRLEGHLRDVLGRSAESRVRIVTGDYLGVTEPRALLRLLDLPGNFELRIFESRGQSFHPKAYILYEKDRRGVAFVGSSNLSHTALSEGVEWNYRVVTDRDAAGFADIVEAFERLAAHPSTKPVSPQWIDTYAARRLTAQERDGGVSAELPQAPPKPHAVQQEALQALARTREDGNTAGLVVLATGLGKTWLSAFDTVAAKAERVLFVAHREEILDQALQTFRRIRPEASLGKYTGTERFPEAQVLFASIQTLGRQAHLDRFPREAFDYIVVDEFHHAAAATYRRLIDHFCPGFLLGLTATPDRTDGGDLLGLCGENLVFSTDLIDGINLGLLCPFRYFGVPDDVDYENIPWRNARFDEEALTRAVATERRAQNAYEQFTKRRGTRALGFCVSQRHADFMATWFVEHGLRAVAVHSGPSSAPRTHSLERLEAGHLDIIFAVDIFNEGVDLPAVDTILMLRPTESRIVWLQQFGRGLRYRAGKTLTVIDYIGNHRSFLLKPRTLLGLGTEDGLLRVALAALREGTYELPQGCSVTYELEAQDIIEQLLRPSRPEEALEAYYRAFEESTGARPTASEAYHDGLEPRAARRGYGSWLGFVEAMGGLSERERAARGAHSEFLGALEETEMVKSYKMLVLLAMLSRGQLPGKLSIDELTQIFLEVGRRFPGLREELAASVADRDEARQSLEKNPIAAWVGGKGTGGRPYFSYVDRVFAMTLEVLPEHRDSFAGLVREIVDWRLAQYLRRLGASKPTSFECAVSHAGSRPIIFLPPRERNAWMPIGWEPVEADGVPYRASFQKIAVNVLLPEGAEGNQLPAVLTKWFGPDAGQPGRRDRVLFQRQGERWVLEPVADEANVPESTKPHLWTSYPREKIPTLFGLPFQERLWQSGIVMKPGHAFLLVTLDKTGLPDDHNYQDRFLSASELHWQSQNRMSQRHLWSRTLAEHRANGTAVHLFVRRSAKDANGAAPFTYCGELEFERWEGKKPVTVWWRLLSAIPPRLWALLGVPHGDGDDR
jgi:superfamily II DNA or RNA helicase/diadenosine tetraphosphate (Ap4A) HIT family hydrolase